MSSEEPATEERIVLAAIACIDRQGYQRVTIRSIAKEAGVNSAAINYYFRSKDRLLDRAMEATLGHLFEDLEAIADDDTLRPVDQVAETLDYLIDGATRYPGVTRSHIYRAMNDPRSDGPFALRMNRIIARLRDRIARSLPARETPLQPDSLNLSLIALFSGAMFPAFMPSFYREFSGVDLRDSRTRKSYVRSLMAGSEIGRLLGE